MKNLENTKDALQKEMLQSWISKGYKGTLVAATGSGKSRCGVLAAQDEKKLNKDFKGLLIVPTEKLRDKNWKEEFKKWNATRIYNSNFRRECYASIAKIKNEEFDLVILDEAHNITLNNYSFFQNNKINKVLGLTATPPEDREKEILLKSVAPISYIYTLNQAVSDGNVADYDITVVKIDLDDIEKIYKGGTKLYPKMVTEKQKYIQLHNKAENAKYSGNANWLKFAIIDRMRFVYNLTSKTKAAKWIIENLLSEDRSLIFCGSIAQADELCSNRYHSKSGDKALKKLVNGSINQLSCVKALNEGHNIPNLDSALVVQLNSKEKDLIQRMGRILRPRPNHIGTIYILIANNTQDEDWFKKASAGLDSSKIKYLTFNELKNTLNRWL
jgi:superfamily II DNA or RNA helicase